MLVRGVGGGCGRLLLSRLGQGRPLFSTLVQPIFRPLYPACAALSCWGPPERNNLPRFSFSTLGSPQLFPDMDPGRKRIFLPCFPATSRKASSTSSGQQVTTSSTSSSGQQVTASSTSSRGQQDTASSTSSRGQQDTASSTSSRGQQDTASSTSSRGQQDTASSTSSRGQEDTAKDNIVTVPNILCVSRIVAAPVISNLMSQGNFVPAAALFCAAGFTDLLDGYIARNFKGQASSLGSFLDPLADKILVGTLYLSLTYCNLIPASLTGLIVSRDLFLVYAGLYIRYMSVPPPFSLAKYFDVSLPSATIQPTTISKINTGLQFLLIAVSLGAPIMNYVGHPYLHYLWAVTGTTTFLSAISYAFMKDTYKFSHREYDHQFGKKLTAFILFILFNIVFTLTFPSQTLKPETSKSGSGDCPITGQNSSGQDDPYSERSNSYYIKQIKNKNISPP